MNSLAIPKRAEKANLKNLISKGLKILKGIRLVKNAPFKIGEKTLTSFLSFYEIFDQEIYYLRDSHEKQIIIDIGANIGIFSLYALKKNSHAIVYAFEPDPDNFRQLCNNIKINGLQNKIIPFQKAIAKKSGQVDLYKDRLSSRGHSLIYPAGNKIQVHAITLDDLFEELKIKKCDFLKIDIEGAEYEILYNCSETLFKKIDCIMLEHHGGLMEVDLRYNKETLKTFLSSQNFRITENKKSVFCGEKIQ